MGLDEPVEVIVMLLQLSAYQFLIFQFWVMWIFHFCHPLTTGGVSKTAEDSKMSEIP